MQHPLPRGENSQRTGAQPAQGQAPIPTPLKCDLDRLPDQGPPPALLTLRRADTRLPSRRELADHRPLRPPSGDRLKGYRDVEQGILDRSTNRRSGPTPQRAPVVAEQDHVPQTVPHIPSLERRRNLISSGAAAEPARRPRPCAARRLPSPGVCTASGWPTAAKPGPEPRLLRSSRGPKHLTGTHPSGRAAPLRQARPARIHAFTTRHSHRDPRRPTAGALPPFRTASDSHARHLHRHRPKRAPNSPPGARGNRLRRLPSTPTAASRRHRNRHLQPPILARDPRPGPG